MIGEITEDRANKARHEETVKGLYQDTEVAQNYIDERLRWSWWRHLHQMQVAKVNRVIARRRPARVLEIAPGPARLTAEVSGVSDGVMVEASPQMIEVATGRLEEAGRMAGWRIHEGSAFELDAVGGGFDFCYTFRFIRHFEAPERERMYREIHRALNPGGLVMFDLVGRELRDKIEAAKGGESRGLDVYDATYSDASEIGAEMAAVGFETVELTPVLKHFFLQSAISYTLDHRLPAISRVLVNALDGVPSSHPLEWIGLFRKA